MEKQKQKTIATVNNTEIAIIEETNGQIFVPIKPICQALGIAARKQIEKLKSDEILSSTGTLRVSVGADKKEREMYCLPYKYIFGWLFRINAKNVSEDAREAVIQYQRECYDVLFQNFTEPHEFIRQKQEAIEKELEYYERASSNFKNAKNYMNHAKLRLKEVRHQTLEDWKYNGKQLDLPFTPGQDKEEVSDEQ